MNILRGDSEIKEKIFNVGMADFEELALQIFHFQYTNNEIYRQYCQALKTDPVKTGSLDKIPFFTNTIF